MDIIRSKLNLNDFVNNDWFGYIVSIFNSEKVSSIWKPNGVNVEENENTGNKNARFYINDNVYIEMKYTSSSFILDFYIHGYKKNIINVTNTSYYLNCIIIYRQGNCIAFNIQYGSTTLSAYTLTTTILLDSINGDSNNIVAIIPGSSNYFLCSNYPNITTSSYWYYSSNSTATINTIQLVPFVLGKIDAQFDTIYGVCISPIMNRFVMFNNEKWLLTCNGIAIPCGDEINYYYVDQVE